MPEFNQIKWKFVDTLLKIPGMNSFQMRSTLLKDLPDTALIRDEYMARHDLDEIISGLKTLGRLNDQGGTRPLIVVAENALHYVSAAGDVANALNEVIQELTLYYGGDIQPEPPPPPAGQQEAMIFGLQRDSRLSFYFIEGAIRIGKSVSRLSVPRIFNGKRRKDEHGRDEYMFGTGWLVAPGLIITNYHVIEARDRQWEPPAHPSDFQAQSELVEAWFDYQHEAELRLSCQNSILVASDQQLDYAIIQLAEAAKVANRAPLRIVEEQPQLNRGDRLNIAQHSGGGTLRYAIRNNFFVRPGDTSDSILYQTDTEPGASGSPVCDDAWQVVALHHASKTTSAEQVPQEVIDGKPVTVTILNEAISIHSVLKSLPAAVYEQIMAAQKSYGWVSKHP